ncbi:hypothetical protein D6783_03850 [Candidatus Woesearchaeota archaeon]|nr:MAG: hypothetical protein D6783_03850 [Candidatus Woesearchaeota archaeon]
MLEGKKRGEDVVDLLGAKKQRQLQESIEQQIKILATNVEVLNQKLIQDPNAAITPGEAIIKKQTAEALQYLKRIEQVQASATSEVTEAVTQQVQKLQATFQTMVKELDRFPQEKAALSESVENLKRIIDQLDKLDKSWLADFLAKVDVFNKNVTNLNNNLVAYHNGMVEAIDKKVGEVASNVTLHLQKNLFWVMVIIAVVVFTVSLLAFAVFNVAAG